MKTREWESQGIRPIGRIMMHHGKRVENYTLPKRPTTLRVEESKGTWHSGRERERLPSLSRCIVLAVKTAEIQRRVRRDVYTPCTHLPIYLPLRMAFYPFVGMESRYPMLARCARGERIVRESNSALLGRTSGQYFNGDHNIASYYLERKSIPLVFAHVALHGVISVIESTDVSINYRMRVVMTYF